MLVVYLLLGFFLLVKGADFFVTGASSIAKRFKIPSLVIGLTIVSIGTSAPEASVSITAGLSGSNALALSNVLGSNIFNTIVVLGACALFKPIKATKQVIRNEFPIMLVATVLTAFFTLNMFISRLDAGILFLCFIAFMIYVVTFALKNKVKDEDNSPNINIFVAIILLIGGATGIIYGGDLVVNSAKEIAYLFNLSETLVGLTIVAVGTSLPELVTSLVAAKKGESDIALGNVIGSNIFNLLFILGASALITPMPVELNSIYDSIILSVLCIYVFLIAKVKGEISKKQGALLLLCYVAYTAYIIIR